MNLSKQDYALAQISYRKHKSQYAKSICEIRFKMKHINHHVK